MSTGTLDVFALRDSVVDEYKRFATSFTTIHADDIREQVETIYAQERYWPEPLIQINPSYRQTTSITQLVAQGVLEPGCAEIFQAKGAPLSLYKHQEQAIALASEGESFVVTTGTGSGKSLCFFIPIINHVLKARRTGGPPRTHAIVIYPMNALANSQLEELGKFVGNVAGEQPVTFARFTGQEKEEERNRIAENPPDILLTNFMMLELLMTRQKNDDRRVIGNCAGLRYWLLPRVLELTYTAWDLQPFAEDCGDDGPPYIWDSARRFQLQSELDAAFFHLYGIARDDVDYILDTFRVVRRNDKRGHGEYRTKRVILEIYDEMAAAARTSQPYQTRLDPPPADPRVAHPPRETKAEGVP